MSKIWFKDFTLETLTSMGKDTMLDHIGIEFTEIGDDYIRGRMPVDHRTHQPHGILHGGASVVLAETLASVGCQFTIDWEKYRAAGLEINANHIRSISSGYVTGTTRPYHIGRRTQVWETRIEDGQQKLICVSRITIAVLER